MSPPGRLRVALALALALLTILYLQRRREAASAPAETGSSTPAATATPPLVGGAVVQVQAAAAATGEAADPAARQERLQLAEERLSTYRSWAQYPPGSRPARENADQLYPLAPVVRTTPLSRSGQPSEHIGVQLRQDRLAVVGTQTIELGIRCVDSQGKQLPCAVLRATLSPLPGDSATQIGQRTVSFAESRSADSAGELVATLRPVDLQLGDRTWPLRVEVELRAGSDPVEQGSGLFDFLYTPEPPALVTGKIREAIVDGSLVIYYGLEVRRPGRYVLHARLDDADGKPFALLEWNDLLAVGPTELPLVVFGKLLLDQHPAMPLKLRDFEGFLLREGVDPDREQLQPQAGYHYSTQSYPSSRFSPREWQSEERTRHEREFERDVSDAQK